MGISGRESEWTVYTGNKTGTNSFNELNPHPHISTCRFLLLFLVTLLFFVAICICVSIKMISFRVTWEGASSRNTQHRAFCEISTINHLRDLTQRWSFFVRYKREQLSIVNWVGDVSIEYFCNIFYSKKFISH